MGVRRRAWVADIAYVQTETGWLYLAEAASGCPPNDFVLAVPVSDGTTVSGRVPADVVALVRALRS